MSAQSTPQHVLSNLEIQRRQYDWSKSRVRRNAVSPTSTVIYDDLGRTARRVATRRTARFDRLGLPAPVRPGQFPALCAALDAFSALRNGPRTAPHSAPILLELCGLVEAPCHRPLDGRVTTPAGQRPACPPYGMNRPSIKAEFELGSPKSRMYDRRAARSKAKRGRSFEDIDRQSASLGTDILASTSIQIDVLQEGIKTPFRLVFQKFLEPGHRLPAPNVLCMWMASVSNIHFPLFRSDGRH